MGDAVEQLVRLAEKRNRLVLRAHILELTRHFFRAEGFLEVNTPVLSHELIPEEHIDPIEADAGYLLPSPELHMKSLLAAGYGKIFQIGPAFRKGERGRHHLPEFTLLEWYRAGADYGTLAHDVERLLLKIAGDLQQNPEAAPSRVSFNLALPWPKLKVQEAFRRFAGWDPLAEKAQERFEEDFALKVIPALDPVRPIFLFDFPAYAASLARLSPDDPRVAERFELFVGGLEIANGFSELTDACEQRQRFEAANRAREKQGKKSFCLPEKFLAQLDGLGPCAGIALGMDRLIMLFTGARQIEDVVSWI